MNKKRALLSVGYWFSAYTLGLLLHPYKTARELTRRQIFQPLFWFPSVFWLVAWGVGFVGLRFGGEMLRFLGIVVVPGWLVWGMSFVFWWLTVFLLLWQGLLLYLRRRFDEIRE